MHRESEVPPPIALTKATADAWLHGYVAAWESYDPDQVGALFSEDAIYYYSPFDDPIEGRLLIVASWLKDRDTPGTYEANYETVAVDGDLAVATGRSLYYADATKAAMTREFENVFLIRFDDQGRCRSFQEWYMQRRRPTASADDGPAAEAVE